MVYIADRSRARRLENSARERESLEKKGLRRVVGKERAESERSEVRTGGFHATFAGILWSAHNRALEEELEKIFQIQETISAERREGGSQGRERDAE